MKVLCVIAEKSWERIAENAVRLSSAACSFSCAGNGISVQADLLIFCPSGPPDGALSFLHTVFAKRYFCRIEGSVTEDQFRILDTVALAAQQNSYDLILFTGSTDADLLAVRAAVRLSGSALTAAEELRYDGHDLLSMRSAFSYNMRSVCRLTRKPWCVSIRPDAAEDIRTTSGAEADAGLKEASEKTPFPVEASEEATFLPAAGSAEEKHSDRSAHRFCTCTRSDFRSGRSALEEADLVLIGGRGIGGKDGLMRLRAAAERLHGAVGVSRPCAADGWTGFDEVVGISGKTVRPKVCLVFAVSGSMPFLMGIRNSSLVIAVNRDPGAPIFRASDYGVASDWKDLVEILERDL